MWLQLMALSQLIRLLIHTAWFSRLHLATFMICTYTKSFQVKFNACMQDFLLTYDFSVVDELFYVCSGC